MSTATITARVWTPMAVDRLGIFDKVKLFLGDHGIDADRCAQFEVLEDEPLLRARVYRYRDRRPYVDLGQVASEVVEVPLKYQPPFTNVEWR